MIERRTPLRRLLVAAVAALGMIGAVIIAAGPATAYPPTENYPTSYPGLDPRSTVGGSFKGEISVDYCYDGYYAIGRGQDDGIWASAFNAGGTWSPWKPLGGKTSATPVLWNTPRPAPSYCQIYVRGLDNRLYFADLKPGLPAANWQMNPAYGFLGSGPTIASLNGTQTMAVRGTDGVVYTGTLTVGGVASWSSQGGQTGYAPSIRAVYDAFGGYLGWCLSVIGIDSGPSLGAWWEKCSYGPNANQWLSQGGIFQGTPGSWFEYNYGKYSLRAARAQDGTLWMRSDNTGWFGLGGQMTTERPGFGYNYYYPGGGWRPWVGVLAGDGRTWQRTSDDTTTLSSWSGFQQLG